jgi:hypothetical protein
MPMIITFGVDVNRAEDRKIGTLVLLTWAYLCAKMRAMLGRVARPPEPTSEAVCVYPPFASHGLLYQEEAVAFVTISHHTRTMMRPQLPHVLCPSRRNCHSRLGGTATPHPPHAPSRTWTTANPPFVRRKAR